MVEQVGTPRNRGALPQPKIKQKIVKLSIARLLNSAVRFQDGKTAQWVHIVRTAKLRDNQGRQVLRGETTTIKPNTPPERGRKCSFRPVDPSYTGKLYKCEAVIADCNCERFKYVWEYALWYRGAAQLLRSNGEHPVETNPSLQIGLCKHLIVLSRHILTKRL